MLKTTNSVPEQVSEQGTIYRIDMSPDMSILAEQGSARIGRFTRGLVVPPDTSKYVKSRPERVGILAKIYKMLEKYPFL